MTIKREGELVTAAPDTVTRQRYSPRPADDGAMDRRQPADAPVTTDRSTNAGPSRPMDRRQPPDAPVPADPSASTGPPRPVVVMLGLFTMYGRQVSAVMIEGDDTVWLDLITPGGTHTHPLATITGVATRACDPEVAVEPRSRDWADRPENRWFLIRETARLYWTYVHDRRPATTRCPKPGP